MWTCSLTSCLLVIIFKSVLCFLLKPKVVLQDTTKLQHELSPMFQMCDWNSLRQNRWNKKEFTKWLFTWTDRWWTGSRQKDRCRWAASIHWRTDDVMRGRCVSRWPGLVGESEGLWWTGGEWQVCKWWWSWRRHSVIFSSGSFTHCSLQEDKRKQLTAHMDLIKILKKTEFTQRSHMIQTSVSVSTVCSDVLKLTLMFKCCELIMRFCIDDKLWAYWTK